MLFDYYALYRWMFHSLHSFYDANRTQPRCEKSNCRTKNRLKGIQALQSLHFAILNINYKPVTSRSHLAWFILLFLLLLFVCLFVCFWIKHLSDPLTDGSRSIRHSSYACFKLLLVKEIRFLDIYSLDIY